MDAARALSATAPNPTSPPATGKVKVFVAVLSCVNGKCDLSAANSIDYTESVAEHVAQVADFTPHNLPDAPAGHDRVAGWRDLSATQQVDAGEPFQAYGCMVTVTSDGLVQHIDIPLQGYSPASPGTLRAALNAAAHLGR